MAISHLDMYVPTKVEYIIHNFYKDVRSSTSTLNILLGIVRFSVHFTKCDVSVSYSSLYSINVRITSSHYWASIISIHIIHLVYSLSFYNVHA